MIVGSLKGAQQGATPTLLFDKFTDRSDTKSAGCAADTEVGFEPTHFSYMRLMSCHLLNSVMFKRIWLDQVYFLALLIV